MALWIATSDRQLRKRERDDADFTQAKLVIVTVRRHDDPAGLWIVVTNKGGRPIIDVTFVRLLVEGHDLELWPDPDFPLSVVKVDDSYKFVFYAPAALGDPFRAALVGVPYPSNVSIAGNQLKVQPTIIQTTSFTATVQFTDANGKRWERTGTSPSKLQALPVRKGKAANR